MMDEPSFLLRANYAEPFDEGLAEFMTLMLYRPEVSVSLFGLSTHQAAILAKRYRLKSLFDLREKMADSLFEFEAYADPAQDLASTRNTSGSLSMQLPSGLITRCTVLIPSIFRVLCWPTWSPVRFSAPWTSDLARAGERPRVHS